MVNKTLTLNLYYMKQKFPLGIRTLMVLIAGLTTFGWHPGLKAQNINVVGNNLTYTLSNGEAILKGFYDDEESTLTVPDAITYANKNYPVTIISTGAFASCPLTSVELGKNVRTLERRAFNNNRQLVKVTFNEKLDSIGEEVFMNCAKLSEITFTPGLRSMAGNSFKGCKELKKVTVAVGNPYFTTLDNAVVSKNMETLVMVSPGLGVDSIYTVPSGIRNLISGVFMEAPFKQVNLPESLQSIGERAFYKASIYSLTIPAGVTSIGEGFVAEAPKLKDIVIAVGNNNFEIKETFFIDKKTNVLLALTTPFKGTDLVIPSGVSKVGAYIFNQAPTIVNVEIPSSVKELGEHAFSSCPMLETVKLNEGIEKIGKLCFFNEAKLTTINFPSTLKVLDYQCLAASTKLTSAKLNEGLEVLDEAIFASCDGLKEVYLPKSLKKFGSNMFSFATSLEKVELPEWLEEIPDGTCSNCKSLTSIVIPKGVKRIGQSAFYGVPITEIDLPEDLETIDYIAFYQTNITNLVIPDKVSYIGNHSFGYCGDLKTVKLGKGVRILDVLCFNSCVNMEELELNEGLDSIGDRALSRLQMLESIKLPSTLSKIGPMAFMNSSKLKDVYALMTVPVPITEDDYIFADMANGVKTSTCSKMTLHVPASSLEAYKNAPVWRTFGTILGDISGINGIESDGQELTIKEIYDLQGNRLDDFVKGINIVVYSNGMRAKLIK